MFNSRAYYNSRSDGFGVLEIADESVRGAPRQFAPLQRTNLTGEITGPLAALRLTQTFQMAGHSDAPPIEALYRFPLPGDAAVMSVYVRFGDVEIRTTLKERVAAESEYDAAKQSGRQAALLTRESPDVFTLAVAGIRPGQAVQVETHYVQLARAESGGWSLRIPLTTSPRYVRSDEAGSRHVDGQPLAVLRDPGHRFALDLMVRGAGSIASSTHPIQIDDERVRLQNGEVLPDRDCVLTWKPVIGDRPALMTWVQPDRVAERAYFLALCAPPAHARAALAREVIVLVDHSGSMSGPKWEAADWAVERFLGGLTERDSFALGVFHSTTRWFAKQTQSATFDKIHKAVEFLKASKDNGGTELGVALEQALDLPRVSGSRSRHVLIITDAEVSDTGRLLRLADREGERTDRRRLSVLCIDAAPNAVLATELAERGGGVSRFLTSDPAEDDVTTALDEVLTDWAAPEHIGLSLEVNRPTAEVVGRTVCLRTPGPLAAFDLGDPPAGRPVWVAGRAPLAGGVLNFRLATPTGVLAESTAEPSTGSVPGLKALFGAERVRRLEYLMNSGLEGDELRVELDRLGHSSTAKSGTKVYAENARAASAEVVRNLLISEALDFGLASAETAFVAVRTEAGEPVSETVVVANALPAGWSDTFVGGITVGGTMMFCKSSPAPARYSAMSISAPAAYDSIDSCLMDFDSGVTTTDFDPDDSAAHSIPSNPETHIQVSALQYVPGDGAVLFDSTRDTLAANGRLTALSIANTDGSVTPDAVGSELTLLVFVGDLTSPRARVRLVDVLRQGGRRPLNMRRTPGEVLRLVLADPEGKWQTGIPAFAMTLSWEN